MQIDHPILQFKNVSISYTPGKNAVNHVNADIKKNRITAIMGPSGCGKSTLLRAINRMHELYPDIRISGEILMDPWRSGVWRAWYFSALILFPL